MYQNAKSATTAGLLGIFLGSFGAHNWYLGEKSKGIAHVCMMSGGILVEIIAAIVLPEVLSFSMLLKMGAILTILTVISGIAMSASGIWGLVEGIMILTQGDAGLARKGYQVAVPAVPQNNYGMQPMNNGYNMPGNMSMNNNGFQNNGYNMPGNNGMNNNGFQGNNMNNNLQNGGDSNDVQQDKSGLMNNEKNNS